MGTRSLTYVYDDSERPLICMYRQMDGYPEGHGRDLFNFLSSGRKVNGLSMNEGEVVFNGVGCMAAQLVAHFKDGPGGFYMEPTSPRILDCNQEYEYEVHYGADHDQMAVRVIDTYARKRKKGKDSGQMFYGTLSDFGAWLDMLKAQAA